MKIGLTSGVFDLIHVGHLSYLERCRKLCDKLIVGVDCDALVRAAKGSERPFTPELQRLQLIQSLAWVDSAFLLREINDLDAMAKAFRVNSLFKHDGWADRKDILGLAHGANLVIVPDEPGLVSTTEIVEKIRGYFPKVDGQRYAEGDEIRVIDFDNQSHDAVLRRVVPVMHECDDEPCRHRIWAAVWPNKITPAEAKAGVSNSDHVWPISDRDWGRVAKHR